MESYEERLACLWEAWHAGRGPHPLDVFLAELDAALDGLGAQEGEHSHG